MILVTINLSPLGTCFGSGTQNRRPVLGKKRTVFQSFGVRSGIYPKNKSLWIVTYGLWNGPTLLIIFLPVAQYTAALIMMVLLLIHWARQFLGMRGIICITRPCLPPTSPRGVWTNWSSNVFLKSDLAVLMAVQHQKDTTLNMDL